MHASTLIAVIDAQKAGDQPKVYSALREAYAPHERVRRHPGRRHRQASSPTKFDGQADSQGRRSPRGHDVTAS